jgi:hypothetical protein
MRGSLSLFNDLLDEQKPLVSEGGERPMHIRRNECLVHRHFFKLKFTDKRFNKVLQEISDEFFLSQSTVTQILEEHADMLYKLKTTPPEKDYYIKTWPHLVWKTN